MRLVRDVIKDVERCQAKVFDIKRDALLRNYLCKFILLPEDVLYVHSQHVEPKDSRPPRKTTIPSAGSGIEQ